MKEPVESLGVFAFAAPHDTGPIVIDHQRQILVMLAPRDLIDTDPEQAIQPVRVKFGYDDTFARSANGAPRHPA